MAKLNKKPNTLPRECMCATVCVCVWVYAGVIYVMSRQRVLCADPADLHLAAQLCKSVSLWALPAKRDHQQRWTPPDWRPEQQDTLANMLIGFVICTLDATTTGRALNKLQAPAISASSHCGETSRHIKYTIKLVCRSEE